MAGVAHPHWPGGGWKRHGVVTATVAEYVPAVATVVLATGDIKLLLAQPALSGLLVWRPLGIQKSLTHIPQVGHLELGL